MATTTTNLGLSKPAYSDDADVAVINGNMDILDTKIGAVGNTSVQAQINTNSQAITKVQNELAYTVGNTNTTGSTLAVGQFVYVKGHSTIAEGLRKVIASISANGNITTNNTSPVSEGGLNALNSNSIKSKTISVTTNANGNVETHIGNIIRAYATDSAHSTNCVVVPYAIGGIVRIFDNTLTVIANTTFTLKVYYVEF